jgi:hypothetical protein
MRRGPGDQVVTRAGAEVPHGANPICDRGDLAGDDDLEKRGA